MQRLLLLVQVSRPGGMVVLSCQECQDGNDHAAAGALAGATAATAPGSVDDKIIKLP